MSVPMHFHYIEDANFHGSKKVVHVSKRISFEWTMPLSFPHAMGIFKELGVCVYTESDGSLFGS